MLAQLRSDLWETRWGTGSADESNGGDMLIVARRFAFLAGIGEPDGAALCGVASNITASVIWGSLGGGSWGNAATSGLTLYNQAAKVAAIYDWCFAQWNSTFSGQVSAALLAQAAVVSLNGGSSQNTDTASNWQGSRGASAILALLASDAPPPTSTYMDASVNRTRDYLLSNYGPGGEGESFGWNIESLGYNFYPSANFIAPAGLALARNTSGGTDLRSTCGGAPYLAYSIWAATQRLLSPPSSPGSYLAHGDFSDDNADAAFEGMGGLSFAWAPEALLPGIRHCFDALMGSGAPQGTSGVWDRLSGGTIWSILYYRDDIIAQDPQTLPAWAAAFQDAGGNGMFLWRNGYGDASAGGDIIAVLYAKLRGGAGHQAPDGLGLRLTALNNSFIIGGGRYGAPQGACGDLDCYLRSQTTLYPLDPDSSSGLSLNTSAAGVLCGLAPYRNATTGAGTVCAHMTPLSSTGVQNHTRRVAVNFGGGVTAAAAMVIVDTSIDGAVAQFMTLSANYVSLGGGGAAQANWTVMGADGGSNLRATVLHPRPQDLVFSSGSRLRSQPYLVLESLYPNGTYIKAAYSGGGPKEEEAMSSEGGGGASAPFSCGYQGAPYTFCNFVIAITLQPRGVRGHPIPVAEGDWDSLSPVGNITIGDWTVRIDGDSIVAA